MEILFLLTWATSRSLGFPANLATPFQPLVGPRFLSDLLSVRVPRAPVPESVSLCALPGLPRPWFRLPAVCRSPPMCRPPSPSGLWVSPGVPRAPRVCSHGLPLCLSSLRLPLRTGAPPEPVSGGIVLNPCGTTHTHLPKHQVRWRPPTKPPPTCSLQSVATTPTQATVLSRINYCIGHQPPT